MPLGTGYDYYITVDHEAEKQQKLMDKVCDWWGGLDDNEKFELMENEYPDRAHLMGLTEMWEALDWDNKLDIYRNKNKEEEK